MCTLFLDYQVLEGWKEHITRNMKQVSADHSTMGKNKKKKELLLIALLALLASLSPPACCREVSSKLSNAIHVCVPHYYWQYEQQYFNDVLDF